MTAEDFRKLCQGILDQASVNASNMLHIGTNTGQEYAIMARLNNGNWYWGVVDYHTKDRPTLEPVAGLGVVATQILNKKPTIESWVFTFDNYYLSLRLSH